MPKGEIESFDDYHYYGPYSFELAQGWTQAAAQNRLHLVEKPGRHGVLYTVFTAEPVSFPKLGALPADKAKQLLKQLADQSDVVLELAATLRFFAACGDVPDPEAEVRRRKPVKATPEGLKAARSLLHSLGLAAEPKRRAPAQRT
jgi:uncharacterized protein YwgA